MEVETIEHTFLLCPWPIPVWFGSQLQVSPSSESITCLEKWLLDKFQVLSKLREFFNHGAILLTSLLWEIWKSRNDAIFKGRRPDPRSVIKKANVLTSEYLAADLKTGGSSPVITKLGLSSSSPQWRPPPQGKIKCNVDAAFKAGKDLGAIAALLRDSSGRYITGKALCVPTSSSLQAEALAIREGLVLTQNCLCEDIILESDNLPLIEASRSGTELVDVQVILNDINRLKKGFRSCGFTWIKRLGNRAAHEIANLASQRKLSADWSRRLPPTIDQMKIS